MKLFKHQEDVLEQTKGFENVAYYLDMGLGKTHTGSEATVRFGNKINLIICQKSKIDDWIEHFEKHYEHIQVLNLTDKKQFTAFEFVELSACVMVVGIINYELVWRRKQLLQLHDFTLMLDESSLIQNSKAKQSKFILNLKPKNVILLSGTPTSGKYENLWSQIHLLGWNISEALYNKQYVNWKLIDVGGFMHKVVDKENPYKNVDRLKQKLREHGAVFMKTEECFDLPGQNFIIETVPTTKEYKKFMRDSIVQVHTGVFDHECDSEWDGKVYDDLHELVGETTLVKRLYARQLCGHYNKDKRNKFKELVESTQDRLIVFYNYNAELEALKRICDTLKRPYSQVNGQVKDLYAYENENNSITLIQYQAGAKGLNLQKANKIIYFTLTDKCEDWMQSQKRIHRIGQDKTCFYYILMCKGSIEEDVYSALQRGVDYTDELFLEKEN